MDPLQELLARDQIRQLADRYAVALDGKDLETLATLFVDDVDYGRHGSGREGAKAWFDFVLRPFHCSMHMVGNHVIDFDSDDRAHGIVYCRVHHHYLDPEHWSDLAMAYWDTYERHDDRWYFRNREPKAWYRQRFGHPDYTIERTLLPPASFIGNMPEAFATFADFWSRPATTPPGQSKH
jgi:hypothetical protein